MHYLYKCIFRFSRLPKIRTFSNNPLTLQNLQLLYSGSNKCKKHFSSSTTRWKKDEAPSTLYKYEKFSEETAPIILDVEEERQKVTMDDVDYDEFKGFNLERGVTGVFDITEIVDLLRKEKAEDIFVLKIPQKYNYVDYMVIANGRSKRHMLAMCDFVRRLYKKKVNESDLIPKLEGIESSTWMAVDLGNICLHIFSQDGRKKYDLETLWSVGKEYDSLTQLKSLSSGDLSTDFAKILASLSPNT